MSANGTMALVFLLTVFMFGAASMIFLIIDTLLEQALSVFYLPRESDSMSPSYFEARRMLGDLVGERRSEK